MSQAKKILERYTKIKSKTKKNEDDSSVVVDDKPVADPKVVEAVKWLKENDWSGSNAMQDQAAAKMKTLAESDDNEANKFMEHLDAASTSFGAEPVTAEIDDAEPVVTEDEEVEDGDEIVSEDDEDEEEVTEEDEESDDDEDEDEVTEEDEESDSEDDEDEDEESDEEEKEENNKFKKR